MRIIGRIGHPTMQITVFSNDGRFPVQFELTGQTQIYRFRTGERMRGLEDVKKMIDADFTALVLQQFTIMQRMQSELLDRHAPANDANDFGDLPDII